MKCSRRMTFVHDTPSEPGSGNLRDEVRRTHNLIQLRARRRVAHRAVISRRPKVPGRAIHHTCHAEIGRSEPRALSCPGIHRRKSADCEVVRVLSTSGLRTGPRTPLRPRTSLTDARLAWGRSRACRAPRESGRTGGVMPVTHREVGECPVCKHGGMLAATRCGFCWTPLSSLAHGEDEQPSTPKAPGRQS